MAENGLNPGRTLFFLGGTVFCAEIVVMTIMSVGGLDGRLTIFPAAVLNSLLLLLLIFPVFHYLLFRPMVRKKATLRATKSELSRTERELALMAGRNEMLLAAAEDGILGLDRHGRTIFTNPAAERILGWSGEELIGKKHHSLINPSFCERAACGKMCPVRTCLSRGEIVRQVEEQFRRKDGSAFPAEISCAPMRDGAEIIGAALTFRDITERKRTEEKLKNLAYFDDLTGLPNRSLLRDRFNHLAAYAQRAERHLAVIFIDLDDFKQINDQHGHAAGDAYLRAIGDRIQGVVRDSDTVARLGGDEFAWAGCVGGMDDAATVAEKILGALAAPVQVAGSSFQVTASIGIAFHGRDGTSFEDLLKAADAAMYGAKGQGKCCFSFSGGEIVAGCPCTAA